MGRSAIAFALALVLVPGASGCCNAEPASEPVGEAAIAPSESVPAEPVTAATAHVVVHHGSELQRIDLRATERLDLAMSQSDQVGHLDELDPATACDGVDLIALAEQAPRVVELRISGCGDAIKTGLSAFGPRLAALTLADVTLDGVTIGNLRALTGLRSLTLTRVAAGPDRIDPLRELPIERLVLRNLEKDSALAKLASLWSASLREVVLEGDWAYHEAMTALSGAEAIEVLELRGTRVGNFSLNQIKPLARLRDLTLEGNTFNDSSFLYFRELPVKRLVCDCPRIGDGALNSLKHTPTIEILELRETSITGEGLEILRKLERLRELVLLDRDIGAAGFAALAALPGLRRLELSGPVEDPRLTGLGALAGLEVLRLGHPDLDDRVSVEIGKLVRLQVLDVSGSRISDAGLAHLRDLVELRELDLGRTRVTNRGLAHVAALRKLEVLQLHHTDVVDAAIALFASHPTLRELRLDDTLVTDACIDTLLSMPALERLGLADTIVTDAAIARLRTHPRLHIRG